MAHLIFSADHGGDDDVRHHAVPRRRHRLDVRDDEGHLLGRLRASHHLPLCLHHQLDRHRRPQSGKEAFSS